MNWRHRVLIVMGMMHPHQHSHNSSKCFKMFVHLLSQLHWTFFLRETNFTCVTSSLVNQLNINTFPILSSEWWLQVYKQLWKKQNKPDDVPITNFSSVTLSKEQKHIQQNISANILRSILLKHCAFPFRSSLTIAHASCRWELNA